LVGNKYDSNEIQTVYPARRARVPALDATELSHCIDNCRYPNADSYMNAPFKVIPVVPINVIFVFAIILEQ